MRCIELTVRVFDCNILITQYILYNDVNSSYILQDDLREAISLRCTRGSCTQTLQHISSCDANKCIQLLNSGKQDGYVLIIIEMHGFNN